MKFSLAKRLKSFSYAINGMGSLLKTQHNAWIHLLATVSVVILGVFFNISGLEWSIIALAITIVWFAEAMNTAIEFVCDMITTEQHPLIGKAKDVAAAGVFFAALGAAAAGVIIFLPHLKPFLSI